MDEVILKVQAKGRLTLPKHLMEEKGIKEGDFVKIKVKKLKFVEEEK
ncbi:AbrB/MazE/SpoVT family DNA-binding domain-containing protein [Methanosarcinales archaeon]|nr:MAG: AbrB/MazE/SpoVT family DNA-binding domain-containing protein [Methanosarcinales archaeon]